MSKAKGVLVDNAADAEQVARAQLRGRMRDRSLRDALAVVARMPEGERLFEEITERAAFFRTTFSPDALQMAHDEGRRAFGLWLLDEWLAARPDAFAALLERRAQEQARLDAQRTPNESPDQSEET